MKFDIDAARSAGYSDSEIAEYLATENKFDLGGALKSGYTPSDVIDFLAKPAATPAPAAESFQTTDPMGSDFPSQVASSASGTGNRGFWKTVADAIRPEPRKSVMEQAAQQDPASVAAEGARRGPVSQQYVNTLRAEIGKLPLEQRMPALEKMAQEEGIRGAGAEALLFQVRKENSTDPLGRMQDEDLFRKLKAAPQVEPTPRKRGSAPAPAQRIDIPEIAPTIQDMDEQATPADIAARRSFAGRMSDARRMDEMRDPNSSVSRAARQNIADQSRTVGEWAADTVSSLVEGTIGLVQLPVNIISPSSGLADNLREAQNDIRSANSEVAKASQQALADRLANEDGFIGKYVATVGALVTNPTLSINEGIKQIPNFMAVIGLGRLVAPLTSAAAGGVVKVAERASPMLAVGEAISGNAIQAGARAIGANAGGAAISMGMAAGDAAGNVYERLTDPKQTPRSVWEQNPDYQELVSKGTSPEDAIKEIATAKARMAAVLAAPAGLLGYMGTEATIVSRGLAQGIAQQFGVKKAATTFIKDNVGEQLEEGLTQGAGNIAARTVDPSINLLEGVPQAMGTAAVTSAPFSALGAAANLRAPEQRTDGIIDRVARGLLDPNSYDPTIVDPSQTVRSPSDIGPSAPPMNFTPADSPSAEAGLAPIIVPGAPNVSGTGGVNSATGVGGVAGSDQPGGSVGAAGLDVTGATQRVDGATQTAAPDVGTAAIAGAGAGQQPAGVGLPRPLARSTDADLLARTQAAVAAQENNNANIQPAEQWFGRKGDGYATQADASQALPGRQRMFPELGWKVEQMPNGKFRLAGYSQETVSGAQAPQAVEAKAQGQEASAASADTVGNLTAAQFMQNPAQAIASAQKITFAPGQLAAVKVSDRKQLAAAFDIQEMDDGTTVFVRQPAPQGQALDQQAAGTAAPAQVAPGAGNVVGQGSAPQASSAASEIRSPDAATIESDLVKIQDAHLKRFGKPVKLTAVQTNDGGAGLAGLVARSFKAPITFIRGVGGPLQFNAYNLGGRLYINEKGDSAPVAAAMHEVGHNLPEDIRKKMIAGVMLTVTPEQRANFLREFSGYQKDTKEKQDEELVMRIIEQDAQNPQFWEKLADRMGDNDFAQLAREILRVLDRIIAGFVREDSSEFTTDINKVRELVADAYAEAKERIAQQKQEGQSEGSPSESRTAKESESGKPRVGKVDTHVLNVERGERTEGKTAKLSDDEKAVIADGAKSVKGVNASDLEKRARDNKKAHPPSDGWAPLKLTGVKVDKDTGKAELQYQVIPYQFNVGPNGTALSPRTLEYEAKVATMAQAMLREVRMVYERAQAGDEAAKKIIAQSGWYKEMRTRLRQEFGGLGDLFADLLGATSPNTPVRTNWDNSIEALRLATQGQFDELLPKWVAYFKNLEQAETAFRAFFDGMLESGMSKAEIKRDPQYQWWKERISEARDFPDSLLPVKSNGKKFGFNGFNVARAMVDLWRVVQNSDPDINRGGTAPKAINFSGNLIGFRARATIDVWAARMLQRLAGGLRIPSMAEGGVTGEALESGRNTLQFGFGQDVFSEAVGLIRNDPQLSQDDVLRAINDDDLQALVWFIEKEVWTKGNWTSAAGEGGSFEFEADLAGVADRERVTELRKVADSSIASTAKERAQAEKDIQSLTAKMEQYPGVVEANATLERNAARIQENKLAAKGKKLSKDALDQISKENADARAKLSKAKKSQGYQKLQKDLEKARAVLKKPTQEERKQTRADALKELEGISRTVDRYTLGLTIQKGAEQGMEPTPPTDAEMASLAQTIVDAAVAGDNGATVIAVKAIATEGRYGAPERSLDFELITNEKYDARPLAVATFEAAQEADQDAAFVARVLRPREEFNPLLHRPGIEIYFRDMNQAQEAARIMAETVAMRIYKPLDVGPGFFAVGGYTVIVDGRPTAEGKAGQMGKPVGMRVIYMPEFEARYGIDERLKDATENNIRDIVKERASDLLAFANEILARFDGVSFAGRFNYEVDTRFAGEYQGAIDAYSNSAATTGADLGRGQVWQGRSNRESIAAAVGRLPLDGSQSAGEVSGGDAGEGSASERRNRSDAAGDRRDRELGQEELRQQVTPSYGTPREGAASAVGYHYSTAPRSTLFSQKFGSGLKGAEMERLQGADPRLLNRVYFYIDRGTGINPEAGVGGYAHRVNLQNLYDADEDNLRLARDNRSFNDFESAVIDAGFDGYMVRDAGPSGNAVLLGAHAVRVEQLGSSGRRTTDRPVPAAKPRALTDAEQIAANKSLPSGQLTGKRWAEIIQRTMPEVFANFASSAAWTSDRTYYKDELARELSTPSFSERRAPALDDANGTLPVAYSGYVNAEVPRVQAARKLTGLLKKFDDGKLTPAEFELRVRMLADRMAEASAIKQANRGAADLERGADIVREKLLAARRRGEIPEDTTEFALWALAQNPALASGLAISVREQPEGKGGSAGDYNPAMELMRVFKGAANADTGVHEILHHGERMMPGKVQDGIRKEWGRAYAKAMASATGEQRAALEQILPAMAGSEAAQKALNAAFKDGTLTKGEHYHLVNPSEYWAVNATAILRRRYEAGSWIADAKRWLGEMLEKVKGLIGLRSDAPILRGLKAVMEGDGERQSSGMLANVSEFNDIARERAIDDFDTVLDDAGGGWTQKGPYPGARKTKDGFWLSRDGNFTVVPMGGYGWSVVPLDTARFVLQNGFGNAHPNRWAIKAFELAREGKDPAQVRGDAIRDFEGPFPDENELKWIEPVVDKMIQAARGAFAQADDVTQTPEFQNFFDGSKVVDSDGRPKVMYHATYRSFNVFDRMFMRKERGRESLDQVGNWFSDKPTKDGAGMYIGDDFDGANIVPAYLSIKNPWTTTFKGLWRAAQRMSGQPETDRPNAKSVEALDNFMDESGIDGIHIRPDESNGPEFANQDVWVARRPEQIKSATGNSGAYGQRPITEAEAEPMGMTADEANAAQEEGDIRFSLKRTRLTGTNFDMQSSNRRDAFRIRMQDDALRLKRIIEAVEKQTGTTVGEAQNFYDANTLMPGRIQAAIDDYKNNVVRPLVDKAVEYGIDFDELAMYAYAMHAKERNAAIASINQRMPDGGSGMTDAEADNIIQMVDLSGDRAKFDDLHQMLMAMTANTRQLMLAEGLIDQDQFDAMNNAYQNYIPLRGFENVDEETGVMRPGVGRGVNVRGAETIRAMGRKSKAGDLIENVIRDYERAISRIEKNDVGKVLLDFVLTYPDPDLWSVDVERTKPTFNKALGIVQYTKSIDKGEDTIGVKVGGQQIYIKLADKEATRALRQAWKDESSGVERFTLAVTGWWNNWMRAVLTRYNPAFAAINIPRDALWSGLMSTLDDLGPKGVALYVKNYGKAMMASTREQAGVSGTTNVFFGNPQVDRMFQEFRAAGGITGGFYMRSLEDINKDLRNELLAAGASPKTVGEILKKNLWSQIPLMAKALEAGGMPKVKANRVASYISASGVAKALEFLGAASENATRFAMYMASREMGNSPAKAAKLSKDGTTNFNRKGEWGGALNNTYLFYNAGVQGIAQLLKVLKNPKVMAAMAGVTGVGMMLASLGASGGGEDDDGEKYWDKIPGYVKERNLVIMLSPGEPLGEGIQRVGKRGRYITIPVQYGFNFFPNLGYVMADVMRNAEDKRRGMTPTKAALHMASVTFGSANPFGGSVDVTDGVQVLLAVMPTLADLPVQLVNERNTFGSPSAPAKSPFDKRPDSERMFTSQQDTVPAKVAKALNELGGGNEGKAGSIAGVETSITPGTIDTVIKATTGGLGAFVEQVGTSVLAAKGEGDVKANKMPIVNRFYGEVDESANIRTAAERMAEIRKLADEVKAQQKVGIDPQLNDEEKKLIALANMQDAYQRAQTQMRKAELEIIKDPKMTEAQKKLERQKILVERDKLATEVNRDFLKATK